MTGEHPAGYEPEAPPRFESRYDEYRAAGYELVEVVVLPTVYDQMSEVVRVISEKCPAVTYATEHHRRAAELTWQRVGQLQALYYDVVLCPVPERFVNDALHRSGSAGPYSRVSYDPGEHRLVLVRHPKTKEV